MVDLDEQDGGLLESAPVDAAEDSRSFPDHLVAPFRLGGEVLESAPGLGADPGVRVRQPVAEESEVLVRWPPNEHIRPERAHAGVCTSKSRVEERLDYPGVQFDQPLERRGGDRGFGVTR